MFIESSKQTMSSKWEKLKLLGKGSSGSVFLSKPSPLLTSSYNLPPLIAVKSAVAHNSSSLKREKIILHDLKGCPEIIHCFGDELSIEKDKLVYNLLLEYADGGTLEDLVEFSGGQIEEFDASGFTMMLLNGLSYMHQMGYVHCDLKSNNILVYLAKEDDETLEYSLKIADFGLAKVRRFKNVLQDDQDLLIRADEHDVEIDIWALGCVVAEMLVGKSLWHTDVRPRVMYMMVSSSSDMKSKWFDILPEFLSENAKDFIMKCMTRKKSESVDRLLTHPFITQFEEE